MDKPNKSASWGGKVAVVILSLATFAHGQGKMSKDLPVTKSGKSINVIVQYRVTPTATHFGRLNAHGAKMNRDLRRAIKGGAFAVPGNRLQELANDPDVVYISPDRPLNASTLPNDLYETAVNAAYGWGLGYDGTGIGVAVIDSGVNQLKDFKTGPGTYRIVYSQSFVPGDSSANDGFGHGTHVAGIIGGSGANSSGPQATTQFQGIAPNVNIVNLRVLDNSGGGSDSSVISAIQTAISLKDTYNIKIINLSVGRPPYESYTLDPLCQAVEQAWNAGIVVVVAAGNMGRDNSFENYGYGTINVPGNDPYVITVGSMKPMGTGSRGDDLIATYSSKGPTVYDHIVKPDIVAPGNNVISTLASTSATLFTASSAVPTSTYLSNGTSSASSDYMMLSGTSMATPVVAGAAALLLQQNSQLTPDQVKAKLMKTADKTFPSTSSYTDPTTGITYNDQYDIFTIGAGYLDIQAALQLFRTSRAELRSDKDSHGG
ncbi:MAG TPA: S8 family peptidase [Terriglobales bacterium]|nr:S8 family peptidase [Terriglobales bacterium]